MKAVDRSDRLLKSLISVALVTAGHELRTGWTEWRPAGCTTFDESVASTFERPGLFKLHFKTTHLVLFVAVVGSQVELRELHEEIP